MAMGATRLAKFLADVLTDEMRVGESVRTRACS